MSALPFRVQAYVKGTWVNTGGHFGSLDTARVREQALRATDIGDFRILNVDTQEEVTDRALTRERSPFRAEYSGADGKWRRLGDCAVKARAYDVASRWRHTDARVRDRRTGAVLVVIPKPHTREEQVTLLEVTS